MRAFEPVLGLAAVALVAGCVTGGRAHERPAGTMKFSVITAGRRVGDAELSIAADGTRTSQFRYNDRGRGPDIHTRLALGDDGTPRSLENTGHDYLKNAVDERLTEKDQELSWRSPAETGSAKVGAGFFLPVQGPFDTVAVLARALVKAPGRRMALLPSGEAWIEDDRTLELAIGGKPARLRRIAIGGLGLTPDLIWLGENDELFASVSSWLSYIREGAEAEVPKLLAEDQRWRDARAARLAGELAARPPAAGLAFVHARLFDSERRAVREDATVVVRGDRISAVGDATTPVPAGAQVIDARGRMLVPGLWDMHVHLTGDDGLLELASGVTTVRDLGNDIDELGARVARYDSGKEVGPRVLRAGLIDGTGELAAPIGPLVSTREEALAAVKRFADLGYVQIKIYSSVKPELVPVIIAAAHERGLRVSGHVPNGMNATMAVEAGFDELQHVNFLFLNFLATLEEDTRTPLRFTRVAEKAGSLDLSSKPVTGLLDLLEKRHTVLDPTLVTFEAMFVPSQTELPPFLVPYEGQLPASLLRSLRGAGLPADAGKRAVYRASFKALGRLVKLAWDRGITIVAGTDELAGISLPRELELYVAAGLAATEVLALSTLGAARVMGKSAESGSISAGKQADLVLIDGDPTRDISAIRRAEVVVCRGLLYEPARLFEAAGMRPRAK